MGPLHQENGEVLHISLSTEVQKYESKKTNLTTDAQGKQRYENSIFEFIQFSTILCNSRKLTGLKATALYEMLGRKERRGGREQ